MADAIVTIRVDENAKKRFDKFCEDVGINMSAALNMFIYTVIREQKIPFEISSGRTEEPINDEVKQDSMLIAAIEIAIDTGRISTSLLQTKLSLGYSRAARIVDAMEKMNIIGPFDGSQPRKVLMTKQEFLEQFNQ